MHVRYNAVSYWFKLDSLTIGYDNSIVMFAPSFSSCQRIFLWNIYINDSIPVNFNKFFSSSIYQHISTLHFLVTMECFYIWWQNQNTIKMDKWVLDIINNTKNLKAHVYLSDLSDSGSSSGGLWIWYWISEFHKMQGIHWTAEWLLASQELCSRELVNQLFTFHLWIKDQLTYKKINSLIATTWLLLRGPMNPHIGGITSV